MKQSEVEHLNYLLNFSGKNDIKTICVDNLHYPFVLLKEDYVLPRSPVMEVNFDSANMYLTEIKRFIPEAIFGCNVLPDPRPKRDSNRITLVKEFSINNYNYLYALKLDVGYLGGASTSTIVSPSTQGFHPAVKTNKIFFSVRILPVEKVVRENGAIIDFMAKPFQGGVFDTSIEVPQNPKYYSQLFDDIDYTPVLQPIKKALNFNADSWKLGKIYEPIGIEYTTMTIKFLELSSEKIISRFTRFSEILESVHKKKSH